MAHLYTRPGDGVVEKRLTKLEFSTRVGFVHEAALDQLQEHASCPRDVASQIRTLMRWLDRPEERSGVSVSDARTEALADLALGILSSSALMTLVSRTAYTTEEAAALRAVWLDPAGPEPIEDIGTPKVLG